jgi:hypothetical protein
MTFAIILGIWLGCAVIASPLIGSLLFSLDKDQTAKRRVPQGQRSQFSSGKGVSLSAPQPHRDVTVQTARRAARGRV